MKRVQTVARLCAILVVGCVAQVLSANEVSKSVHRLSSKAKQVDIENHFGQIDVKHWDKKEIDISVKIEATASTDARAKELLSLVNIEFSESGDKLIAKTKRNNIKMGKGEELRTIYTVSIPQTAGINLSQKYGNITLPPTETRGDAALNIEYGNLAGGVLVADCKIDVSYGNMSVDRIQKGDLNMKYCGKVRVSEIQQANINLSYSHAKLDSASDIAVKLSYGGLESKAVGSIKLDSKYSNVKIGEVKQLFRASSFRYSDATIRGVGDKLEEISIIESRYSKLNANLSRVETVTLDLRKDRYSTYNVSDAVNLKNKTNGAIIRVQGNYNDVTLK